MRNDFKESTGTKNKVDAVKTEKFRKDDPPGGPDETSKKPPTRPPSSRGYRFGKSPGHVRQNFQLKPRFVISARRNATGPLFARPGKW